MLHQTGALAMWQVSKHSLQGGVVFIPHHLIRIPVMGRGGGSNQDQVLACLPVFCQFFIFSVKKTDLYSNRTGYEKCIAAHQFASKFLFLLEKY
jgi:hypothetical protein